MRKTVINFTDKTNRSKMRNKLQFNTQEDYKRTIIVDFSSK